MDYDVLNAIEQRKSVRNYDGKRLPDEIVTKLRSFLKDADNPFAVKVDLRYLDAGGVQSFLTVCHGRKSVRYRNGPHRTVCRNRIRIHDGKLCSVCAAFGTWNGMAGIYYEKGEP